MATTKFTKKQLEEISHSGAILRACDQIPFQLANKINASKIAADIALKNLQDLIEARNSDKDETPINKDEFEISIPEIKTSDFEGIQLSGHKEAISQIGLIRFFFRDAYFNLLDLVIIQA